MVSSLNVNDDKYVKYLLDILHIDDDHTMLPRVLNTIEFSYNIKMDSNRNKDAIHIRNEYEDATGYRISKITSTATVLEFLVALSGRLEDILEGSKHYWFYKMLENLKLIDYSNQYFIENGVDDVASDVKYRISNMMSHRYNTDGTSGGLFPVKGSTIDMRNTEYWLQMQEWILRYFMPQQ